MGVGGASVLMLVEWVIFGGAVPIIESFMLVPLFIGDLLREIVCLRFTSGVSVDFLKSLVGTFTKPFFFILPSFSWIMLKWSCSLI